MATIPEKPQTNLEQYLNRIATGDGEYPAEPHTNVEQYLNYIIEEGVGGGGELVTELPPEGKDGSLYVLVDDAEHPTKAYGVYSYAGGNYVLVAQTVDQSIQIVSALPQEGQEGVLYYLEKSGQDDTYDMYRWVNSSWVKVDTDVKLYSTTGENTDGPMTQKAATDATKFATGEAVSSLKVYSGLGNNGDGFVLQKYIPSNIALGPGGQSSPYYYMAWRLQDSNSGKVADIALGVNTDGLTISGGSDVYGNTALRVSAKTFTGATSSADGARGMVPKPLTGDEDKVLKGDGTWTINYKTLNGAGAPTTSTVGDYIGQLYYDTTNDKMYYLVLIDISVNPVEYIWNTLGGGPAVVQTTGTSTTDVMSQVAVSNLIWPTGYESTKTQLSIGGASVSRLDDGGVVIAPGGTYAAAGKRSVAIGWRALAYGSNSAAIGQNASTPSYASYNTALGPSATISASSSYAVAVGSSAVSGKDYSVALGSYAYPTRVGEVNIGTGTNNYGYNSTSYRVLGGVHPAVDDHDAVTLGQMNEAIASAGATVISDTQFNTLWENA